MIFSTTFRRVRRVLPGVVCLFAGLLSGGGWLGGGELRAADLSGCWSGSWQSCTTGHHGPLRATFSKCGESQYQVTFSGRFFKIMPFRYSVTLDVVEDGDAVRLSGSSFLGRLMGTFTYAAEATACSFQSSYSSCKDNGWFRLTKCS